MRLFRHFDEILPDQKGAVVALGNFDGIHLGHQDVIGTAIKIAQNNRAIVGVMSFEPHPQSFFSSTLDPFRLTPFRMKAQFIESLGVDFLLLQRFDKEFSSLTAEQFILTVLMNGLAVSHVVVGYDFAFGQKKGGNCETLQKFGRDYGFSVTIVEQKKAPDGILYASHLIREALKKGNLSDAYQLLGRTWTIEGRVEQGDKRGRQIGFPTANIGLGDYLRPAKGVYVIRAKIDHGEKKEHYVGIANLGTRPTFDKKDILLEVHLFDFQANLYGKHMEVTFLHFLRPEQKFSDIEALKTQISLDCQQAKDILAGIVE